MADSNSRAGAMYFTPEILEWCAQLHAAHDSGLQIAFDAPKMSGMPAIQVAPSEGKLLELLVRLSGAKKIVEVGTLAAYSTIRLARAMPPGGKVWSIEYSQQHAHVARANVKSAGLADSIEIVVGAGLEVLPQLERHGPFDAVFIDADKENYAAYGRWAAKHTRVGGLLLGDNAFLFGELLGSGPRAEGMRQFHTEAAQAYDTVCIPTPDGLLLGMKR